MASLEGKMKSPSATFRRHVKRSHRTKWKKLKALFSLGWIDVPTSRPLSFHISLSSSIPSKMTSAIPSLAVKPSVIDFLQKAKCCIECEGSYDRTAKKSALKFNRMIDDPTSSLKTYEEAKMIISVSMLIVGKFLTEMFPSVKPGDYTFAVGEGKVFVRINRHFKITAAVDFADMVERLA